MHDTPAFDNHNRSGMQTTGEDNRLRVSDRRRSEVDNDATTAHFGTQRVSNQANNMAGGAFESAKRTPSRKEVAQSSVTLKEV